MTLELIVPIQILMLCLYLFNLFALCAVFTCFSGNNLIFCCVSCVLALNSCWVSTAWHLDFDDIKGFSLCFGGWDSLALWIQCSKLCDTTLWISRLALVGRDFAVMDRVLVLVAVSSPNWLWCG